MIIRWRRKPTTVPEEPAAEQPRGDHNARDYQQSTTLASWPWRQGRKVPRNVYAHNRIDADDDGVAIGSFDSEWLAFAAVCAHNDQIGYHPTCDTGHIAQIGQSTCVVCGETLDEGMT